MSKDLSGDPARQMSTTTIVLPKATIKNDEQITDRIEIDKT